MISQLLQRNIPRCVLGNWNKHFNKIPFYRKSSFKPSSKLSSVSKLFRCFFSSGWLTTLRFPFFNLCLPRTAIHLYRLSSPFRNVHPPQKILIIALPTQNRDWNIPLQTSHIFFNLDSASILWFTANVSVRKLGAIFVQNLCLSEHVTRLPRSSFMHRSMTRRIQSPPCARLRCCIHCIPTSIVHVKLDYCNSLFLNIDTRHINHFQAFQSVAWCGSACEV